MPVTPSPHRLKSSSRYSPPDGDEVKTIEEALRKAEQASRVTSEFIATISHEIRTPLNAIIGMTGLLLDSNLTPFQRDMAETVRRSGEHLLTIINDVLDFSKLEAGRLSVHPAPMDLQQIVEEVIELMAPHADAKGLDLILHFVQSSPRYVIGDSGRIRQILLNLTGNAVKFTRNGHVTVRVVGQREETDRIRFVITVEDTGIGIPAEKYERIFEKFSQADSSTTRRFGGSGLGLCISRELAHLMGGTLSVASTVDVGSTFRLDLVLPLDTLRPPSALPLPSLQGRRILIVADGENYMRPTVDYLTSWGVRVRYCKHPDEALSMLRRAHRRRAPYHAVLIDAALFTQGSFPIQQRIKNTPELATLPQIPMISFGKQGSLVARYTQHREDYIIKPVRPSELQTALEYRLCPGENSVIAAHRSPLHPETPASTAELFPTHESAQRVLIAEDNATNQRLLRLILERRGFRVDMAADGNEALQMMEMLPYDLILMDCQMPEMDGYQATVEIRKREGPGRRTPIIALTAGTTTSDAERCLAVGMDARLVKPIRTNELLNTLYAFLPIRPSPPRMISVTEVPNRVVDLPALLAKLGEDRDTVRSFIDLLVTESDQLLHSIHAAIEKEDREELRRIAHALKGAMMSVEAQEAQEAAERMELLAQENSIEEASAAYPALKQSLQRLERR